MGLPTACLLVAAVALAPLTLYVLCRRADPFNPLLLAGGITFGIADWKLLRDPGPALRYFPASAYVEYLLVVGLSLLSFYAGWYWRGWRRGRRAAGGGVGPRAFDPGRLLKVGLLMAVMALIGSVHFWPTGYIRDWGFMQLPAAVVLIQAYMLDRRLLWSAVAGVAAALYSCVYWFFVYGSRGDAGIMLALVAVPFLFRGTRPRKPWVLIFGFAAAVAMMTLAETRPIVANGEAPNRIAALMVAGKKFLHGGSRNYGPGREFVVGAAEVQAVQKLQNWDYGRVFPDMLVVFLPRQLFPEKYDWVSDWISPHFIPTIRRALGLKVLLHGVAPTGFADGYVQFSWLYPVFWLLLGYLTEKLYAGAVYGRRPEYQCYLVSWFVVLLYLIAQGIGAAGFNALFTLAPAWLAYRYARVARVPAARSSPPVRTGPGQ
jgi:hypothetical protein